MKRLLIILIGVPILLLLGLVCVFFYVSLDIKPPNTSDLVPERTDVADVDNAFTHFKAAVEALDWPEDEEHRNLIGEGDENKQINPQFAAELLLRNKKALELLNRGLNCRVCQTPEVQSLDDSGKNVSIGRPLARVLVLKTKLGRETNQYSEATESCGQIFKLGCLIQANAGCLVDYIVGSTILNQGFNESRKLAMSTKMPQEDLEHLAKALHHIGPFDRRLTQALKAEYQFNSKLIDDMAEGKGDFADEGSSGRLPIGFSFVFQPNKTKHLLAEDFRGLLENVSQPACTEKHPDILFQSLDNNVIDDTTLDRGPNSAGKTYIVMLWPALNAFFQSNYRCEAELAATRLIVACRRYEKDHGKLPAALDDLAPKYLDAVPRDPFDGRPMRYDKKRAIIYSIGIDLIDSAGSEKPMPDQSYHENRWNTEDAVFHIHGRPKADETDESQQMK